MAVLIVTGASKGIGAKICVEAAKVGWACAVNFASDAEGAARVVSTIEAAGGKAFAVQADVSNPDEVSAMFRDVDEAFGPVTGLVNNAGTMGSQGRVEDLDVTSTRRLFEVNTLGPFICSKEALARMSKARGGDGGAIVNISSAASKHGGGGSYVDYAASKGAVDTFTIGLAREQATEGVRVNCIRPGAILTDITRTWMDDHPEYLASVMQRTPLGRPGAEEDIAEAALFLLSDKAKYMTGAILDVSGGWVCP